MNSHVSAILLGVKDMERAKRFYTEGLGWKVQNDWKISVFFVPHGGSMVGFYGRDGLAEMVGVETAGTGFSGTVFNYVLRSESRVDAGWRKLGGPEPRSLSPRRGSSGAGTAEPSLTRTGTSGASATPHRVRIRPTRSSRRCQRPP
jgi:hypothetical protein